MIVGCDIVERFGDVRFNYGIKIKIMADDSKEPAINSAAGRVIFVLCSLKSEYSRIFPAPVYLPVMYILVELFIFI